MEVDLLSFLLSVVFVSLSGVMMPGPVFAVTVAKGYRSKVAGVLIALGHGAIEFPLMFLIYFGFTQFFYIHGSENNRFHRRLNPLVHGLANVQNRQKPDRWGD